MISSMELAETAGISYRQLDYWTRKGYLVPAVKHPGEGVDRCWHPGEVVIASLMKRLIDAGFHPRRAFEIAALMRHPAGEVDIAPGLTLTIADPTPPRPRSTMSTEPITMSADDATELTSQIPGTGFDGWTVAATEHLTDRRWYAIHRLIIQRDADGQHFAVSYHIGHTEEQEIDCFDSDPVTFTPVTVHKRMVEITEYLDEPAEATG